MAAIEQLRTRMGEGLAIPACPLALNAQRRLDERRQRALFRYYLAAGAGGLAVGVHTTQFAIRDPKIGLLRPVLEIAAAEIKKSLLTSAATSQRRHEDVFQHSALRQEVMRLKDETDLLVADFGELQVIQPGEIFSI